MVKYTYDNYGRRVSSKKVGVGHSDTVYYDATTGNANGTWSEGGVISSKTFDEYGRVKTTKAAQGQRTDTTFYDVMNRATAYADGVSATRTIFSYDELYLRGVRNPKGERSDSVDVDALGRVTKRYDNNDATKFQTYRYSSSGRLTSTTNRRNQQVDRAYDSMGALASRTYGGSTVDTYSTTLLRATAANSNAIDTTNIAKKTGFISRVTKLGGESITVRHGWGTSKYSIFSADTLVGTYRGTTNIFFFETQYDTLTSLPKWTQSSYNTARRMNYISFNVEGKVDTLRYETISSNDSRFSYTSRGVTKNQWQSGNHYYQRDSLDRMRIGMPALGWLDYDNLGRLATNSTGGTTPCTSFSADSAFGTGQYQLCSNLTVTTWSYDAMGNRTDNSGTYATGNRITTHNGYTFEHDADGNVTRKYKTGFDVVYTWDELGRLTKVKDSLTGNYVEFAYDALDRIVRRKKNGTIERYFLWDGDNLVAEFKGNMDKLWAYHYSGIDNPVIAYGDSSGTSRLTRYAIKDPGGNVSKWMNGTGSSAYALTYDVRGVPSTLGDTAPSLKWKGLHHEGGNIIGGGGLYYMRARWYDPEIGRFISEDPAGTAGGLNLYVFASNDPINGADPSGNCPFYRQNSDKMEDRNDIILRVDDVDYICKGRSWMKLQGEIPQGMYTVIGKFPIECEFAMVFGTLQCFDHRGDMVINTPAYAGYKEHINDPYSERLKNLGPLPMGEYYMEPLGAHDYINRKGKNYGSYVMRLHPFYTTEMYGRDGMLMHRGSSPTASRGCIIIDDQSRTVITNAGGGMLTVSWF